MSDFEFTMSGEKELLAKIQRLGAGMMLEAQAAGLGVGEELVLEPARARAPMKTGRTRRSGRAVARKSRDAAIIKIIFGGPVAPHARFVHENLEANYKNGEPKFLERTFLQARSQFAPAVAARISLARAVKG